MKYQPVNSREYTLFVESFCEKCARDAFEPPAEFGDCEIHTNYIGHRPVPEWICDKDDKSPRCTAFAPIKVEACVPDAQLEIDFI